MIGLALLATHIATARPNDFSPLSRSRQSYRPTDHVGELIGLARGWVPEAHVLAQTSTDKLSLGVPDTSTIDAVMERLRSFKTWDENWDGEGAPKPDHDIINAAIRLFSLLAPGAQEFGVSLDSNSIPTFYVRDSVYTGHIAVEREDEISFFFRKHDGEVIEEYEVRFGQREIPPPLQAALRLV